MYNCVLCIFHRNIQVLDKILTLCPCKTKLIAAGNLLQKFFDTIFKVFTMMWWHWFNLILNILMIFKHLFCQNSVQKWFFFFWNPKNASFVSPNRFPICDGMCRKKFPLYSNNWKLVIYVQLKGGFMLHTKSIFYA